MGKGRLEALSDGVIAIIKGIASVVLYIAAIALSFVNPWIAVGIYILVAILWLLPDRRIERTLAE